MITRIAAAVVAALTVGSGSAAFAAAMDHDPTTGLSTYYYYYGPISELSNKGLPMKDEAKKYTSSPQRATPQRATHKRGNSVLLLENRGPRPPVKNRQ